MNAGAVVFLRNLIIAFSSIIIITGGVKVLPPDQTSFVVAFIILLNAQNTLYEGLFVTHTMAFKESIASAIFKQQGKFVFIIPAFFSIFSIAYSDFFLNFKLSSLMIVVMYLVFLFNVLSLCVSNIFCTSNRYSFVFIFDCVLTIASSYYVMVNHEMLVIIFVLLMRILSSGVAGLIILYKKQITLGDEPIYSKSYFFATSLSMVRDTILPLLIGALLGPFYLVAIRVFNTCYSAPGLVAGAMNKVIIRAAHRIGGFYKIEKLYLFMLLTLSISYFILWWIGGDELYVRLFGDKKYFEANSFYISLLLFCIFWPLGQLSISKLIYHGLSNIYYKISILWTVVALLCTTTLYYFNLSTYIIVFSLSQSLNILIILYVNRYVKGKDENHQVS